MKNILRMQHLVTLNDGFSCALYRGSDNGLAPKLDHSVPPESACVTQLSPGA
jgi:hypothetical protein